MRKTYSNFSLRIKGVIMLTANWVLNGVSGLYEYAIADANISTSKDVEIIPQNTSIPAVLLAEVTPYTPVSDGSVTVSAKNIPTEDITVDLIINPVKDV